MKRNLLLIVSAFTVLTMQGRETYNFNSGWVIDNHQKVTLPHAWNEFEAYKVRSHDFSDSIVCYTKSFRLPKMQEGDQVVIEFEGAKQAAEVYVNNEKVGIHENGIMAFGFDITPFLKKGKNEIKVITDNHSEYREKSTGTKFQWNYTEFNANYGGITKNVKLHILPVVHQTLPLWSSLGTTGCYIYGSNYDVPGHTATVHAETQVANTGKQAMTVNYKVLIEEMNGTPVASFDGGRKNIPAGSTVSLQTSKRIQNLHFWSWGYGYLYKVKTIVNTDTVTTVTGFRKTEYKDGMIYLNDRVMMVHGYAQRSTNEWPGVGNAVSPWLSDYSNNLFVESGGNVVRWMHITPGKQDIESCDRVGLIEAMPAGDAEGDSKGRQWQQRVEVMRDAIIYNRNNPSILFYESGNNNISDEHMADMKAVRDQYDPQGGRAIGSRNMLDTKVAEYGGEMLYINKSKTIPMWMMEYCRDEGMRKYWNSWSYPYHQEGDGPLYRNAPAPAYNHNMDELGAEFVRRWYDYWMERPGQGTRVNSGGVKIVFSDSQTHSRGEANYRTSGVVDPMRLPKDAFFVQQVMWTGWVEDEQPKTYIMGHWNYQDGFTIPRVYVVSNSDSVRLQLNGKLLPNLPKRDYHYLFTFDSLTYQSGTLQAISYDKQGNEKSSYTLQTAGKPDHVKLTPITNPTGWKADGADLALVDVEVVDKNGNRCPLANDTISFTVNGQAEWLGGVAQGRTDNWARMTNLPVDAGITRIMLRSTVDAGQISLKASTPGLPDAQIQLSTTAIRPETAMGINTQMPDKDLQPVLTKGETPLAPSFIATKRDIEILSAKAGFNQDQVNLSFDNIEKTSWSSDSHLENSWIEYTLAEDTPVDEISLKLLGFRSMSYPIEIYAGKTLVWKGYTPKNLGYTRIPFNRRGIKTNTYLIKMVGKAQEGDAFGAVKEVDKRNDEKKITGRNSLRIIEINFITQQKKQ